MPRYPRQTFAYTPHHIVQRGCRREKIFFDESDFHTYIRYLVTAAIKYDVEIWCYCLMDNHIHLIAFPKDEKSLSKMIGEAHRKYSLYINYKNDWKGHLWEYRFKSFPMDVTYLFHTVRYILRNPIDAGIADHPINYRWSNAHSLIHKLPNKFPGSLGLLDFLNDWSDFISQPTNKEIERSIHRHEKSGIFLFETGHSYANK